MSTKSVLIVITSHEEIDQDHKTGLWFSEFAEPYEAFLAEGYRVTTASIKGGKAPIDPRSLNPQTETKWPKALQQLEQTIPLKDLTDDGFDAIFLPGGHGTMFDLPNNETLQLNIRAFAESGRVVAAVCHGPAGLAGVRLSNGEPFIKGKRVTAFTNDEERAARFDSLMPFMLEDRVRGLGATFVAAPLWSDHVEVDGNLITGQNPQSGLSTAKEVIRALQTHNGSL